MCAFHTIGRLNTNFRARISQLADRSRDLLYYQKLWCVHAAPNHGRWGKGYNVSMTATMKSFAELGLGAEVLRALTDLGYEEPTPIQEQRPRRHPGISQSRSLPQFLPILMVQEADEVAVGVTPRRFISVLSFSRASRRRLLHVARFVSVISATSASGSPT